MRYKFLAVAAVAVGIGAAVFFSATTATPRQVTFKPKAARGVKIENGRHVSLAYKLFVNGTLLETADRKEPFLYVHGKGQIVPGLERALLGLHVGDHKSVHVLPKDAYGLVNSKAFQEVPKEKLPTGEPTEKGMWLEARNPKGETQLVKISEIREKTVVIDFNHPLAGKELDFQVEVLKIK